MDISLAKSKHKQELKKLWKHCFHDDDEFINIWFDGFFKSENTVICTENDNILGALQFVCYDITDKAGKVIKSAYICGVGVYEKYRGLKIGTNLMNFAHEILKERNIQLAFLISEADEFYYNLGYKAHCSKLSFSFTPSPVFCPSYTIKDEVKNALKIYNHYCSTFDFYINRTASEFNYITNHYSLYGGFKTLYFKNSPCAYIAYYIEDGCFYADEIAFSSQEGLAAILDYVYKSGCKKAVITTSGNDGLKSLISATKIQKTRTILVLELNNSSEFMNTAENCFISVL